MASLQVRDLPEELYYKLKEEARRAHRSLAQQAIVALSRGLDSPISSRERRQRLLQSLKNTTKAKTTLSALPSPLELIHEDRQR